MRRREARRANKHRAMKRGKASALSAAMLSGTGAGAASGSSGKKKKGPRAGKVGSVGDETNRRGLLKTLRRGGTKRRRDLEPPSGGRAGDDSDIESDLEAPAPRSASAARSALGKGNKSTAGREKKTVSFASGAPSPPEFDPEDEEIRRLEEKLGLRPKRKRGKKELTEADKKKTYSKFNRAFERDGMGSGIGDFLATLDDLDDVLDADPAESEWAERGYGAARGPGGDGFSGSGSDIDSGDSSGEAAAPARGSRPGRLAGVKAGPGADAWAGVASKPVSGRGKRAGDSLVRGRVGETTPGSDSGEDDLHGSSSGGEEAERLGAGVDDSDIEDEGSDEDEGRRIISDRVGRRHGEGDGEGDDEGDDDEGDDDEGEGEGEGADLVRQIMARKKMSEEKIEELKARKASRDIYGFNTRVPEGRGRRMDMLLEGDAATLAKLRKRVQGIVNRLLEANLDPLSTELISVYQSNGNALVNKSLTDVLLSITVTTSQVLRPLLMTASALVGALHIRVDRSIGAYVIERVVNRFMDISELSTRANTSDKTAPRKAPPAAARSALEALIGAEELSEAERNTRLVKERCNIMLLISYLYVFKVVHPGMVFDLVALLIDRLNESDVEVLLLCFQHCGFQMRSDEPERLRELIADVEARAEADASLSVRAGVMIDLIQSLKNNRMRQAQQQIMDRGLALRKWLNRLASRHDASGIDRRLRMSLDDLTHADEKGRWWVVGASWVGNRNKDFGKGDAPSKEGEPREIPAEAEGGAFLEPAEKLDSSLYALARKLRMNTDVRRKAFVALMGADDPESALERLLKLGLKGAGEREIVRVLVECAGQEATYNPFYSDVASLLCGFHSRFKFTFQLTFWDQFKQLDDHPPRRLFNLAKLLAHLLSKFSLSLAMLKAVDFTKLSANSVLFFRACFGSVLLGDMKMVAAVFSRVGAGPDKAIVRDSLVMFLHQHMKAHKKAIPVDQRKTFKRHLKIAKTALASIPMELEEDIFPE